MIAIPSLVVEVEFSTPFVWVDVTPWVDFSAGGSLHIGRLTQFDAPGPGTFQITLDNTDGRFSPLCQTLNDGTPHPYYPNVLPRKRIRFSWKGFYTYIQFIGYVHGWPTSYAGRKPIVVIEAIDRLDQLQRVTPLPPIPQEIMADNPAYYWPLTDAAGATMAVEYSGGPPLRLNGNLDVDSLLNFGDRGPGSGNGSGVQFTPTGVFPATITGQGLSTRSISISQGAGYSVEFYVASKAPTWTYENVAYLTGPGGDYISFYIPVSTGKLTVDIIPAGSGAFPATLATSGSVLNNTYHHVMLTCNSGGGTELFLDGVSQGAAIVSGWQAKFTQLYLADTGYNSLSGYMGQVALYRAGVTVPRVGVHYQSFRSWSGETVDQRVKRFLGYGGVPNYQWNVDASTVVLSGYPQGDKDVAAALADLAVTESGGAAFYIDQLGNSRFKSRDARKPATPTVTVDAVGDLDGATYQPSFDDNNLINSVSADRMTASGVATTQTAVDPVSIAAYQAFSTSIQSYAKSDADVLGVAQYVVSSQANPSLRLNKVTIDLFTCQSNIVPAVSATGIGDRIRTTNLDVTASPSPTLDVIAEGWSDSFSDTSYTRTYDTSSADAPAMGVWDDAVYGRWQCDGQTLLTGISSSTTTIVIKTANGGLPAFTTASGSYPIVIQIGAEHIRLNNVPTGTWSSQTFTGCTRGFDGTPAAAQAAGSVVNLYPIDTFTL